MISSDTLVIRHLPNELSWEEKEDFLRHFGAIEVHCLGSKLKKTSLVFARFCSNDMAKAVIKRLHQVELLGQHLAVEFARGKLSFSNCAFIDSISEDKEETTKKSQKQYDAFLQRLNNWTTGLDFNHPPPVHLRYQYPPPTRRTLMNIAKACASVPKLYTQVLHLMNRMNLPCPLSNDFPLQSNLLLDEVKKTEPPIEHIIKTNQIVKEKLQSPSEEESELESEDDANINPSRDIVPMKRRLLQGKGKVKRPKFVKPTSTSTMQAKSTSLKPTEVFETFDEPKMQRRIELKLTPDLSSIQEAQAVQRSMLPTMEGFGLIDPIATIDEKVATVASECVDDCHIVCITADELAANRISTRDQRVLAVFKNYHAGVPSCRLYVKNLTKQVVARDLHYIYRRYFVEGDDEQGTMFDIRLMQEGRMKGQAFITLQSIQKAQKALNETNGYILKDKPMVVQFARSSKPK